MVDNFDHGHFPWMMSPIMGLVAYGFRLSSLMSYASSLPESMEYKFYRIV
jgi:hypothetical protein